VREVDFIVVGAGVAGSLLALQLIEQGQSVVLFDDPKLPGSSHIAAGSINPITGRKFVKSWKIDQLIKSAERIYESIESKYDIKVMHRHKVIRGLKSVGMQNDWSARINDPEYNNYIYQSELINSINGITENYVDYAIIENAYRIEFESIINLVKELNNSLIKVILNRFDYGRVVIEKSDIKYGNHESKNIVFAEGSAVRHNPLWSWLPFVPAHGERLIIYAPELKLSNPFNDGKIIIPLGEDQYWIGSNYNWDISEPITTEEGFELLKAYLDKTLTVPYEILDHAGHIRPSTYNRRPFVGRHPEHDNIFILNGMGAKGASLSPYCVEQLLAYIQDGADLDEEIDVGRVRMDKSIT